MNTRTTERTIVIRELHLTLTEQEARLMQRTLRTLCDIAQYPQLVRDLSPLLNAFSDFTGVVEGNATEVQGRLISLDLTASAAQPAAEPTWTCESCGATMPEQARHEHRAAFHATKTAPAWEPPAAPVEPKPTASNKYVCPLCKAEVAASSRYWHHDQKHPGEPRPWQTRKVRVKPGVEQPDQPEPPTPAAPPPIHVNDMPTVVAPPERIPAQARQVTGLTAQAATTPAPASDLVWCSCMRSWSNADALHDHRQRDQTSCRPIPTPSQEQLRQHQQDRRRAELAAYGLAEAA